jgi:hypothetical protein
MIENKMKICKYCDNEFSINVNNKRQNKKIFCSKNCSSKYNGEQNKGRKHSVEVNLKKGLKGELNPFFNKKHTTESKLKMSKSSQSDISKFKFCNMTKYEKEVFDGLLLSDGCLGIKSRISARLTFGFKFIETLEAIRNELKSITFSNINIDKKTGCYHFKSKYYHDLLKENKRWYFNGNKKVPRNIIITEKSCYWWFIGDGYNLRDNVYLCTDSFLKEDNLLLINKLNKLGFKPSLTSKNRIRFNKKDTINFLKWIIPKDGIIDKYKYKWKI